MTNYIENIKTPDSVLHNLGGDQIDGEWTTVKFALLENVAMSANQQLTFDLSSIISDRRYDYEVAGWVHNGINVANSQTLVSISNATGEYIITGGIAGSVYSNSSGDSTYGGSQFYIKISGYTPKIIMKNMRNFNIRTVWAYVTGYRRLGRNV